MQRNTCIHRREAQRIRTASTCQNLTGSRTNNDKVIAQTGIDMHTTGVRCNRIITRTASNRTVRRATQRVAVITANNICNVAKTIRCPTC